MTTASSADTATAPLTARGLQDSLVSLQIRPQRHLGTLIGGTLVALVAAAVLLNVATNKRFGWPVVVDYLFAPQIMRGVGLTLWLTVASMTIGILLGILLAVMRVSHNKVISTVSRTYIWFFRGTPLLVQLIFWYNLGALYPRIGLSLPFGGPGVTFGSANSLVTPMTAALLGLALNEAAYMAEIIRSGISSVDPGQLDAGRAIGMTRLQILRRIVLPQAMRVVIPPTGNQVISMLKGTSLVSVLAISDLLYAAQTIYALNYQVIPLLLVACLWYLAMTSALTAVQTRLEERYARGFTPRRQRTNRKGVTA